MLSKEIKELVLEATIHNFTKEIAGSEMMAVMAYSYHNNGYDTNMLCGISEAYGFNDMKLVITEGRDLFEENLMTIVSDCLDSNHEAKVMKVKTHKGFKALKKSILPAHQVMCKKFKQEVVKVSVRDEHGDPLEKDGRPVLQDKILRYLEISAIGTCRYDKDDMNNVILNVTDGEDKNQPFTDSVVTVQMATEKALKLLIEEGYFFYKEQGDIRLAIPDSDLSGVTFVDFVTLEKVDREAVEVVRSLFFPGQASSNKKATLKFYLGDIVEVVMEKLEKEDVFNGYIESIKANNLKDALKAAVRLGQEGTQSVNMTGSEPLPVAFVVDKNGNITDLKLANGAIKMDGYMAGNGSVLVKLFNNRFNTVLDIKGFNGVNIVEAAIDGLTLQVRPTTCKASCEVLNSISFNEYVNLIKSQGLDLVFSNCSCIEDAAVIITASVAKTGVFSASTLELLAFSHNGNTSNSSIQSLSQIVTPENADRIADICMEKLSGKVDTTLFSDNEVLGLQGILNKRALNSNCMDDESLLNSFVEKGALSVPSVRTQLVKSLKDLLSSSVSGHSYPLEGGSGTLIPFMFDDVLYYRSGETNLFIPKLAKVTDRYNKAVATMESDRASKAQKQKASKIINDLSNKYLFEKSELGYYNLISYIIKYPAVGKGEFVIAHCMGTLELKRLIKDKVENIDGIMNHYNSAEPNSIYILDSSDLQKDLAGFDYDFDHASFITEKAFVVEAVNVRRTSSYMGTNVEELKNGTVKEFLANR